MAAQNQTPGILSALLMLALAATAFAFILGGPTGPTRLWGTLGIAGTRVVGKGLWLGTRVGLLLALGVVDFVVTSWIAAYHLATVIRAHEVPDDVAGMWWRFLDRASRLLAV